MTEHLTPEQIASFEHDGYLIVPSAIDRDIIERLLEIAHSDPKLEADSKYNQNYDDEGIGTRLVYRGGFSEDAFSEVATQVFLDDISTGSGAVLYASGSHRLHFESDDDPGRKSPSREEIEAGEYVPAEVEAGSVIFRIPQVWHAVDPIHRLRRYVTGSYAACRKRLRAYQLDRILGCRKTHRESDLTLIPPHIQPLWHPDPWND